MHKLLTPQGYALTKVLHTATARMKNSHPGRLMPSLLQPKKQRGVHCWQLRRLTLVAQFALPFAFTSEQASVQM